ncbi:MAG: hypothetical protein EHM24_03395 [Acidobacteria bacterium]|nr:MAG: hypothetical protein EHM24_03395 [Acidobacteriota bacterium]
MQMSRRGAVGFRRELWALVFFALLAAAHTWPLASAPGRWCRNDSGDALLNEWAVAWVAHQAVTDPLHLFDANIFYPETRTLALSEHLVPQAAMVAPLSWAGASPVLAHNIALLLGFALTGWAMCHLVVRWTGSWPAGLVAGSLAAFNAHTLTRLAHLQAQHLEFLPLALMAFDRLLVSATRQPAEASGGAGSPSADEGHQRGAAVPGASVRDALKTGAWFAVQGLTSGYFLVFSAVSMAAAAVARTPEWLGRRARHVVPLLVLAAVTAAVLLLPFMLPYRFVRQEYQLVRSLREIGIYSAVPTDYLATGARLHWPWAAGFFRGDGLFPGVVALLAAATTVATGLAFRDRRARMWLAIGLATCCLSFGTNFTPYSWLFGHVPLFDAIRAPIRFGQFTLLSVAALAGFGVAWWVGRISSPRIRVAAAILLVAAVNAEALRAPLGYFEYKGEARILKRLAAQPDAVVAYFPFFSLPGQVGLNGRYMLSSTLNWKPMLNGYSGHMPASFYRHAAGLRTFPLPETIEYLRSVGVTHVVVDTNELSAPRLGLLPQATGLGFLAAEGHIRLYAVR